MNNKWEYYNFNEKEVNKISSKFGINKLLANILVNRGILEEEQIRVFLEPTRKDFHDAFLLPDMEVAVNRIVQAINNNEKIIIYGDYDTKQTRRWIWTK